MPVNFHECLELYSSQDRGSKFQDCMWVYFLDPRTQSFKDVDAFVDSASYFVLSANFGSTLMNVVSTGFLVSVPLFLVFSCSLGGDFSVRIHSKLYEQINHAHFHCLAILHVWIFSLSVALFYVFFLYKMCRGFISQLLESLDSLLHIYGKCPDFTFNKRTGSTEYFYLHNLILTGKIVIALSDHILLLRIGQLESDLDPFVRTCISTYTVPYNSNK